MILFTLDRKLLECFDRLILEIWNRVGLTKIWQARVLLALYIGAATMAQHDFLVYCTVAILAIGFQCIQEKISTMFSPEFANAATLAGRQTFISFISRIFLWCLTLVFFSMWGMVQDIIFLIYMYHFCALMPTKPRIRKKKEARIPAEYAVGY